MRSLASLFAVLALAGCAPVSSDAASEASIIRGTREMGYPEVVAVYWMSGASAGGLCTGTVIGPHAILTAKHCVFEETGTGYSAVPASDFLVLVGHDINAEGGVTEVHYVAEVRTTPGSDIDADVENGTDIAILLLRDTISIPPRATATSGPSSGDPVTAVGFGRTSTTDADSAGVKYRGAMTVDEVGMRQLSADGTSWTCQGDSGGPLIDASGAVVGITSFGFGRDCRVSLSVFVRVPYYRTLIADALAWAPPCEPRAESCNGLDDDCNGTVDEGIACTQPGEPCAASTECFLGTCEEIGGAMICTRNCFPDAPLDCPAGLYCEVTACGGGRCVPGGPGAGAAGTPCSSDGDCASEHCAPLRGGSLCGEPCCPGSEVFCADGTHVCDLVPGSDGRGACIPAELATGPAPFGSACDEDAACLDGHCADPGAFCTRACDAATPCPGGYHCSGGLCAAGDLAPNGAACMRAEDCADPGALCFEGACARPCAVAEDCPLGIGCNVTDEGMLCVREGTALGEVCDTNEECRSGICAPRVACTVLCNPGTCPEGYACELVGTVNACFRPGARNTGGCSASRGAPGGMAMAALSAVVAIVAVRRRRR
jgi:secreted trypsin-like serine protease